MNKYMRLSKKIKIIIVGLCTALGSIFIAAVGTITVAHWFDRNRLVFHTPVEIAFFQPIKVEERKPEVIVRGLEYPVDLQHLTGIEEKIVEVFGVADAKIAIAIAKAESGLKEEAFHANSNGSVDIGIFQVNSVHFTKPGCSLKELVNAEKNVLCAYQIYKVSGWNAWVGFWNGNWRNEL